MFSKSKLIGPYVFDQRFNDATYRVDLISMEQINKKTNFKRNLRIAASGNFNPVTDFIVSHDGNVPNFHPFHTRQLDKYYDNFSKLLGKSVIEATVGFTEEKYKRFSSLYHELLPTTPMTKHVRCYHGTSKQNCQLILKNGFMPFFLRCQYGQGTYFCTDPSYCLNNNYSIPDDQGFQYILVCSIIVSSICVGQPNQFMPIIKDTDKNFSAMVDNMQKPKIFVIAQNEHVIVEYMVKVRSTF